MDTYVIVARIVLFTMIVVLMTFAGLVLVRYHQLWRHGKRHALPAHVWMVSASYYLLLASLASRPIAHGHVDWRIIFWLPALVLGIMAMIQLLKPAK